MLQFWAQTSRAMRTNAIPMPACDFLLKIGKKENFLTLYFRKQKILLS